MGILIEHFAGAFPLWLAPEQVRVLPISDKFTDYGKKVEAELPAAGFRVDAATTGPRRSAPRSARPSSRRSRSCWWSAKGGRDRDRRVPRPASTATSGRCRLDEAVAQAQGRGRRPDHPPGRGRPGDSPRKSRPRSTPIDRWLEIS